MYDHVFYGLSKLQHVKFESLIFVMWIQMFQLCTVIFLIPLKLQDYTVPPLKAPGRGKYESRELCCSSTFNICQDILKIANLQHKQGFGDSEFLSFYISHLCLIDTVKIKWNRQFFFVWIEMDTFQVGLDQGKSPSSADPSLKLCSKSFQMRHCM